MIVTHTCYVICMCLLYTQAVAVYLLYLFLSPFQVVGLQPFTVYSFRVVAVNALGRSPQSKESYYFVTLREGKGKDKK